MAAGAGAAAGTVADAGATPLPPPTPPALAPAATGALAEAIAPVGAAAKPNVNLGPLPLDAVALPTEPFPTPKVNAGGAAGAGTPLLLPPPLPGFSELQQGHRASPAALFTRQVAHCQPPGATWLAPGPHRDAPGAAADDTVAEGGPEALPPDPPVPPSSPLSSLSSLSSLVSLPSEDDPSLPLLLLLLLPECCWAGA